MTFWDNCAVGNNNAQTSRHRAKITLSQEGFNALLSAIFKVTSHSAQSDLSGETSVAVVVDVTDGGARSLYRDSGLGWLG
jgi:hypothetical protein